MLTNIELGIIIALLVPWKTIVREVGNWNHRRDSHRQWMIQEAVRRAEEK